MSTGATPSNTTTTGVPGGAITPATLPVFVTTTSLCTGHETTGLCAQFATTTTAMVATSTPPLPATGADVHDVAWGGSLILLGGAVLVACARRGRRLW